MLAKRDLLIIPPSAGSAYQIFHLLQKLNLKTNICCIFMTALEGERTIQSNAIKLLIYV